MEQELILAPKTNKFSDCTLADTEQIVTNVQALEQSLKSFSYYLVENIEVNLNYCLNKLEERKLAVQNNSKVATTAANIVSVIPYVGKGLAEAIKEGELYILNEIDEKTARKVASLVYFYGNNQDKLRKILIEAAIEIFYCYEYQFMNVTNKDGLINAMHKLAIDGAYRIFNYLLQNKADENITINQITEGIVKGASMRNKYGKQSGRIIKNNSIRWNTGSIYKKCGLFLEDKAHFYKTKNSKTEKYGFRRAFIWENVDDMVEVGEISLVEGNKQDYIQDKDAYNESHNDIENYIMTKTPEDNAKLDRKLKYKELKKDNDEKQKEIIELFEKQHQKQLEYLEASFNEILQQQKSNNEMVNKIAKNQIGLEHHTKLNETLNKIHQDIVTVREGQMTLMKLFTDYVDGMEEIKISHKLLFESWAANAKYSELEEMETKMKLHNPSPKSYIKIISAALEKRQLEDIC